MNSQSLKVTDKGFKLLKKDLDKLLNALRKFGQIIGPVQKGKWLRQEQIKEAKELTLNGLSWYSSKKFVFPQKQTIFSFDNKNNIKQFVFSPKQVLFGLRMCDLNAFYLNDKLFLNKEPVNHNYENYRKNLTLVGLFCDKVVDKYCFCSSFDLKHLYDLCLFDRGDYFHIKVGSKKGEEIVSKLKLKSEDYWKELPECKLKLGIGEDGKSDWRQIKKTLKKIFNENEKWKDNNGDCLSCSDCTSLCPTCLCFDVEDEMEIDMESGVRTAKWDSCMFRDFTLVAGGHIFRNTRINRFKHRIYHKLDYFPEQFEGESMCTGCGRCIRGCPNKIDWVKTINDAHREKGIERED